MKLWIVPLVCCAWVALWFGLLSAWLAWRANRSQPAKNEPATVDPALLQPPLLAFTGITTLGLLWISPAGSRLPSVLHHVGFGLLGAFLLVAEFWRFRLRRTSGLAPDERLRTAHAFRAASLLWAPAAAIVTFLSGLKLVANSGTSLQDAWFFYVFTLYTLAMFHGIVAWSPQAEGLVVAGKLGQPLRRSHDWHMTLHSVVYFIIFVLALDHGGTPLPHPLRPFVARLEAAFPTGVSRVAAALVVAAIVGLAEAAIFHGPRLLAGRRRAPVPPSRS